MPSRNYSIITISKPNYRRSHSLHWPFCRADSAFFPFVTVGRILEWFHPYRLAERLSGSMSRLEKTRDSFRPRPTHRYRQPMHWSTISLRDSTSRTHVSHHELRLSQPLRSVLFGLASVLLHVLCVMFQKHCSTPRLDWRFYSTIPDCYGELPLLDPLLWPHSTSLKGK